ncbi:MAG: PAS domain S-box protein [Anaerolineae bacterium]|nr:PAS domain S-box protein [Anaerolineae bacterium]
MSVGDQGKEALESEITHLRQRLAVLEEKKGSERPERFYEALINNAPDGVVLLGPNFRISYVSPAAERLFGYTVEELMQMSPDDLTHPDDLAGVHQVLRGLIAEGIQDSRMISYRFQRKDKEWRWIESTFTNLMSDEDIRGVVINFRDITDRVEATDALKDSESFYRVLTDALDIALCRWLPDTTLTYSNEKYRRLFNVQPEDVEKKWLDLLPPETREETAAFYGALSEDPKVVSFEHPVTLEDGAVAEYRWIDTPLFDDDGILVEFQSVGIDITEIIRAKEALQVSEERFRAIFENATVGLYRSTPDGRVIMANPTLVRMLGYLSFEELSQRDLNQSGFSSEGSRSVFLQRIESEGQISGLESAWIMQDGATLFVRESVKAIRDESGKTLYYEGSVEDISERVQIEERLRENEERYRSIYERVEDVIYETDGAGTIIGVSPSIERQSGYRPEELIGRNVVDFYTDPDEYAALNAAMEAEGSVNDFQLKLKRKSGELIIASVTAHVVFDENGTPVKTEGVMRDVTGRRQAAETLQESERQLSTLMANLPGMAYRCLNDHEWTMEFISSGCYELTGYQAVELIENSKKAFAELIHPEDRDDVWEKVQAAVATQAPFELEYRIITENGDQKDVWENGVGVFGDGELLFLEGFITDITDRKQAQDKNRQYISRLDTLRKIDQAIVNSFDLKVTLSILLDYLVSDLGVDAAAVLKFDENAGVLAFVKGQGFRTTALQETRLRLGHGHAGKAALERTSVFIPDLSQYDHNISDSLEFKSEEFISYYGVPLIAKGVLVGVLEVFNRSALNPSTEWEKYLQISAGQAAIAIDNIALFETLERSNMKLLQAYDATISGWANALELRDMETEGHSRRVVELTVELAKKMGISGSKLIHVRRGALLHDIGKMGVPDHILQKPGKLTADEWQVMKSHPLLAHTWFSSIDYLRPALDIPYCHHGKWDGTGYPRGLRGEDIPLAARVFAIVDVWDALLSDRPYRKAWSREKTLKYIQEQSGAHFDPQVATVFLQYLEEKKDAL